MAVPQQTDIMAALASSAQKAPEPSSAFADLDKNDLTTSGSFDGALINTRKLICPRKECGSVVCGAKVASWEECDGEIVRCHTFHSFLSSPPPRQPSRRASSARARDADTSYQTTPPRHSRPRATRPTGASTADPTRSTTSATRVTSPPPSPPAPPARAGKSSGSFAQSAISGRSDGPRMLARAAGWRRTACGMATRPRRNKSEGWSEPSLM